MSTDASQPEISTSVTQEAPTVDQDLLQQILAESRQDILKASRIREDAAPEEKSGQLDLVGGNSSRR